MSSTHTESENPIIDDLFQKIIGPFIATQVSPLLIEPDNIDDRVRLLLESFSNNPQFIAPFQILIKSLHTQEVEVPLEEQIRFYTTNHTRNWLLVNLLNSILNLKELKLDEATGRLPAKPHDIIKFSHQARVAFGEESRYKNLVFAAGLYFDFIFYLQRTPFLTLGQLKFDEPITQAVAKAIEQGKLILMLDRHKAKLSCEKFTPATAFIRHLSQMVLFVLSPDRAPDFYKKLSQQKTNEPLRLALELQAFGVHTGILSAYLGQSLPVFEILGEIMSVWGFPYLSWVHEKKDIHDAVGMGQLGVAISERLKGHDFPGAGQAGVTLPELKHLDFAVSAGVKSEIKI